MGAVHYLIAAAGIPNYGDEVIAAGWLRHLARTAPRDEVVLDCVGPRRAREVLGTLHPRVRFTDTLWRLSRAPGRPGPDEAVSRVADAVLAPRASDDPGLRTLLGADVVHLLGGGYVNGLCPGHLGLLAGAGAAARRTGSRAALTGLGLWPAFSDEGAALRRAVEPFSVLDVRDEVSAASLGRDDVSCTGDDLFLDLGEHLYRDGDVPGVMVCAQSIELLDFMHRTVESWGVREDGLGIVECDPGDDHEVFAEAARRWPAARRYTAGSLLTEGFPAAPGQVWITSRFHPHLVAAAAGAAGVAVDHGPAGYYSVKHRSLIDRGSGWTLLTTRDLPVRPGAGGYRLELQAEYRAVKQRIAAAIHG
ncbi:polysaccharide pyruvyl transferase family protein [Streptomyces rimosus]|uniref:polysaccharide pyruvyl transferase family protein n=1 Tax=Streptomyces rimosus TaxID=1927 RepID=UPI0004C652E2|nr:polysaccharide pyruvyl transferase family protein [Streptomyces rimosus]